MNKIIFSLFTIYQLSIARRLLQFIPLPGNVPPFTPGNPPQNIPPGGGAIAAVQPTVVGSHGQQCEPPQSDFQCQGGEMLTGFVFMGRQSIACGVDYSCCLCQSITCGTESTVPPQYCQQVEIGGSYGAFGVKDINILGDPSNTLLYAVLVCGEAFSCADTLVDATNIATVDCGGPNSCNGAVMNLVNSDGVNCGAPQACVNAKFTMTGDIGGDITCGAPESCVGMQVDSQNVRLVSCNGPVSCKNAMINIVNPGLNFNLNCNGDFACEGLKLVLKIEEPLGGCPSLPAGQVAPYVFWKGVTCSSPEACKDLQVTVINDGCQPILIEDFNCEPNNACIGSIFDFRAGTGVYSQMVDLQNCKCGPSCQQTTGIDQCYNNVRVMECIEAQSCMGQRGFLRNPANGFTLLCPMDESCKDLHLDIIVAGDSQNIIRTFNGYDCSGPMGCQGATITVTNSQVDYNGDPIEIVIKSIKCPEMSSCQGTTFITGPNVRIDPEAVECGTALNACDQCTIKETATDPGINCVDGSPVVEPVQPASPIAVPATPETPVVEPAQPAEPVIPTEPAQPEPAQPAEPAAPAQPAQPAAPAEPAIPAVPAGPM